MPVSAAALASASAAIVASPIASRMLGLWGFSRFDLTHPATASKWNAIPPTMQQDILAEAPKASIELLPGVLITRLVGVPDRKATWTVESETADELVIKTSDEGRKKIRFPEPDAMRIEDLDKKDSFVTIFARKPAAAPAPAASASAGTKK